MSGASLILDGLANSAVEPVIMILHSIHELSIQNQVYLIELIDSLKDAQEPGRVMFICSFSESNLQVIHPQLVQNLVYFTFAILLLFLILTLLFSA